MILQSSRFFFISGAEFSFSHSECRSLVLWHGEPSLLCFTGFWLAPPPVSCVFCGGWGQASVLPTVYGIPLLCLPNPNTVNHLLLSRNAVALSRVAHCLLKYVFCQLVTVGGTHFFIAHLFLAVLLTTWLLSSYKKSLTVIDKVSKVLCVWVLYSYMYM